MLGSSAFAEEPVTRGFGAVPGSYREQHFAKKGCS